MFLSVSFSRLAAALLICGMTACIGRIRAPAVPVSISTPIYKDAQLAADVQKYRDATDPANPKPDPAAAKIYRDRMTYGLMADVEYLFRDYESNLFINSAKFNLGSDFLELGLTTAATLGNSARAKTILSALGAAATGNRLSIDKNFFRERTFDAIVNAMEARRSAVEKRILDQMVKGVDLYPFEAALKDLREYFFAGTLEGGLTELQQQMSNVARTNLQRVEATKDMLSEATAINHALAQMALTKKYANLIGFLQAMGKNVDGSTPIGELQQDYRDLANAALDNTDLMKKFREEIKKAGVIQ
jgi:hypothetical protein